MCQFVISHQEIHGPFSRNHVVLPTREYLYGFEQYLPLEWPSSAIFLQFAVTLPRVTMLPFSLRQYSQIWGQTIFDIA